MKTDDKITLMAFVLLYGLMVLVLVVYPFANPEPDPEINEFWTWALGNDWRAVVSDMKGVPARWNERHGDLFELYDYDSVKEGRRRMHDAWLLLRE